MELYSNAFKNKSFVCFINNSFGEESRSWTPRLMSIEQNCDTLREVRIASWNIDLAMNLVRFRVRSVLRGHRARALYFSSFFLRHFMNERKYRTVHINIQCSIRALSERYRCTFNVQPIGLMVVCVAISIPPLLIYYDCDRFVYWHCKVHWKRVEMAEMKIWNDFFLLLIHIAAWLLLSSTISTFFGWQLDESTSNPGHLCLARAHCVSLIVAWLTSNLKYSRNLIAEKMLVYQNLLAVIIFSKTKRHCTCHGSHTSGRLGSRSLKVPCITAIDVDW